MKAKTINDVLNEMAVESVTIDDVVTKNLINEYFGDDLIIEMCCYSYAEEYNLNPEELLEDEEFKNSKNFKDWVIYLIESKFHETQNKFKYDIIQGYEIPIWRRMTVEKDWLKHLENEASRLGIYWSWDPDAAEPHGGYNNKERDIMIESLIKVEHVNWIETLRQNMNPSYEDEKEIRLFKNTPLKIIAIYNQESYESGKRLRLSPKIKNKIFKA